MNTALLLSLSMLIGERCLEGAENIYADVYVELQTATCVRSHRYDTKSSLNVVVTVFIEVRGIHI